jgi:hypothetical protein
MRPSGLNCNPQPAVLVLMLHSAVLADPDALAVLAQLLEANFLALACFEAFRRGFMRRSHHAMTLCVFLLFLCAVLRLCERGAG